MNIKPLPTKSNRKEVMPLDPYKATTIPDPLGEPVTWARKACGSSDPLL